MWRGKNCRIVRSDSRAHASLAFSARADALAASTFIAERFYSHTISPLIDIKSQMMIKILCVGSGGMLFACEIEFLITESIERADNERTHSHAIAALFHSARRSISETK